MPGGTELSINHEPVNTIGQLPALMEFTVLVETLKTVNRQINMSSQLG